MNTSAARYWVIMVVLLGAVYGSFALWRKSQPASSPDITASAGSSDVRKSSSNSRGDHATEADALATSSSAGSVATFQLTDQDGQPFDSASLDGKVWVASFFFTNCPAICWRMNQALAAWQQTHPDSDIHFVSITCDPDNDTPEALKKYADHFKADPQRWTFLTGDMTDIQRIGQESFKITVVRGDHSDRACVVDKQGKIRGRFRLTEADQADLLNRLLAVVEAEPATNQASTDTPEKSENVDSEPSKEVEQPSADNEISGDTETSSSL